VTICYAVHLICPLHLRPAVNRQHQVEPVACLCALAFAGLTLQAGLTVCVMMFLSLRVELLLALLACALPSWL